jgi:hypothetical protein
MLVLGAGLGVATVASADTPVTPIPPSAPSAPAPTTAPPPIVPPPGSEQPDWQTDPGQAEREAELIQALAEMFGVDEAEIRAALEQVRAAYEAQGPEVLESYLDQAVQAGILTQEEADLVRQAVEESLAPR